MLDQQEVVSQELNINWSSLEFYTPFNYLMRNVQQSDSYPLEIAVKGVGEISLQRLAYSVEKMQTAQDFLDDYLVSEIFKSIKSGDTITDTEFLRFKPMLLQIVKMVELRFNEES